MLREDGVRRVAAEDTDLAAEALSLGVKTHPLSRRRIRPGAPGLVLGHAAGREGELEEAIGLLGEALRRTRRPARRRRTPVSGAAGPGSSPSGAPESAPPRGAG